MPIRNKAEAGAALLAHVEAGTTDQAPSVLAVPAERYTDHARWALEMERLFKRLPLLLALTSELREPGDFRTLEVAGLPILIARGTDRIVRAFLNVCTHRGNLLAKGERGNCSRFSCGYHGWTFSADGRLMGVADSAKFGSFDKPARDLHALPCVERGGMIFAVLTPGAPIDIERFYGEMLSELEAFNFQDWHYCGSRKVPGPNWKIAFDGYIESYHFAAAHPTTVLPYVLADTMVFDTSGPHLRIGSPSVSIREKLGTAPREEWGKHENKGYEFIRALFPNTTVFVGPALAHFSQVLPGPSPDRNLTIINFLSRKAPSGEAETAHIEQMMAFLTNTLRTEDYALGLDVQRGLSSGALGSVLFGRNEAGNQFFHKCVDYYVGGDEAGPLPRLELSHPAS